MNLLHEIIQSTQKKWEGAKTKTKSPNKEIKHRTLDFCQSVIENMDSSFARTQEVISELKSNTNTGWRDPRFDMSRYYAHAVCSAWTSFWANKKMQYLVSDKTDTNGLDEVLSYQEYCKNEVLKLEKEIKGCVENYNNRLTTLPYQDEMKHVCEHPVSICIITHKNNDE